MNFCTNNNAQDQIEMSAKSTLQNVMPTDFVVVSNIRKIAKGDSKILLSLKSRIILGMIEKYWSSFTGIHNIAYVLDQNSKSLSFIIDHLEYHDSIQSAQRGLQQRLEAEKRDDKGETQQQTPKINKTE